MHHVFAFALTPESHLPPRPNQPKRSRGPGHHGDGPDHRVLIASVAVGAATCALLTLVATVTVP